MAKYWSALLTNAWLTFIHPPSLLIFYRACKWNKRKGEDEPVVKAIVFHFLCSLMVHRIPLAKGASWELVVTSMQIILISQWKFESCKQNAHAGVAHF